MTGPGANLAAAALAGLGAETDHAALLRSIVRTAQANFGAAASSIAMVDGDELVLEAVARDGEQWLVGHRFPVTAGIAGWVVGAAEPMVVDDLAADPTFARDVAAGTGYVPAALMAAPIVYDQQVLGVLEVLDPGPLAITSLGAVDLLTLFAAQAGVALAVVRRARAARELLTGRGQHADLLPVVETLLRLEPDQRRAAAAMLGSLGDLLRTAS
jgi:GAF domain-containing protein